MNILHEKFAVVDLETTGLNDGHNGKKADSIIEIGAVKIERGRITEKYSTFVACAEPIPKEITELTGISSKELQGAPTVKEAIKRFCDFSRDCTIVGHNILFDYGFIRYYGKQYGLEFNNDIIDTYLLSRERLQGKVENYKLNTVAKHFGISLNPHRALADAEASAKIFLELTTINGN